MTARAKAKKTTRGRRSTSRVQPKVTLVLPSVLPPADELFFRSLQRRLAIFDAKKLRPAEAETVADLKTAFEVGGPAEEIFCRAKSWRRLSRPVQEFAVLMDRVFREQERALSEIDWSNHEMMTTSKGELMGKKLEAAKFAVVAMALSEIDPRTLERQNGDKR